MNIISKLIKYIKDKRAARKEAEAQRRIKRISDSIKESEELRKYIRDNNIRIKVVCEKPVEEEKSILEENWGFNYGMENPFNN